MRASTFLILLAFSISARAIPLPSTILGSASSISSSITASLATSSLATVADLSASVTNTDFSTPTDVSSIATINTDATNSAFATGTSSASATDSGADASVTDSSSLPSVTDVSVTASIVPPTATASASVSTSTDASTASIDSAEPTSTGVSFDVPDVPSACLAIASGATATPTSSVVSTTDSVTVSFSSASVNSSITDSTALPPSSSSAADSSSIAPASVTSTASNVTDAPTATATSIALALPTDSAVNATLSRRIAQADLPDVAQSWQDLCLVSGGDIFTNEPCVQLAGIDGINALLADADACAQQDNADGMIDFAKSAGVTNADALIANAVAYRQHPRNALNINGVLPATPYCQRAPRNVELQGVVNAQLDEVNPGIYGSVQLGLFAFGADGTCPFGQTPDAATCSCA